MREKEDALGRATTQQRDVWFSDFTAQQGIDISLESVLLSPTDVYGHMSTLLYTRLLYACIASLTEHRGQESLQELLLVLKDMGFYHCLIEHQHEMITLLTSVFSAQKSFPEEFCAFLPMTTVKT